MVSIQAQLTQHLHTPNQWRDGQVLADAETVGDVLDRARCGGSVDQQQANPVLEILCRAARAGDQLALLVIIEATTATRRRAARYARIDACELLGDVVEIVFTTRRVGRLHDAIREGLQRAARRTAPNSLIDLRDHRDLEMTAAPEWHGVEATAVSRAEVRSALEPLRGSDRTLFWEVGAGWSVRELAAQKQVSARTVESRVWRARARTRAQTPAAA